MAAGLTGDLVVAALFAALVGAWIARRDLPGLVALEIGIAKAAVPFAYFAWFFQRRWTFNDDYEYLEIGRSMLNAGFDPLSALTTERGLTKLFSLAGGRHILYGWWNVLGQWLFGSSYYATVFLNVALTFVCGAFLVRIARRAGFSATYQRWFLAFFLLHWDVIAWSSLTNLKDVLMMTLTAGNLLAVYRLRERFTLARLGVLLAGIVAVSFLRFYAVLFLVAAAGLWWFMAGRFRGRWLIAAAAAAVAAPAVPWVLGHAGSVSLGALPMGLVRFPLTPQPWSVAEGKDFLIVPATFHWLLYVPALLGAILLWRRAPASRLVLLYGLVTVVAYAATPLLQGVRQRVQLVPIFAWMQFHFAWEIARDVLSRERVRARAPALGGAA